MEKVLMIDDDIELCEMMTEYLAPEDFAVSAVHDGPAGVARAHSGEFALVLLDVMLPGINGFEVLRRLRASDARIPVLMLTARGDAIDRIVGLEVGADDYLPKPFDERELVARMRAILRRTAPTTQANEVVEARDILQLGDISLDISARVAKRAGNSLVLTAVEFDLLALLLRGAGRVVTREQITRDILDRKLLAFDRSVDTHISRLRRKLGTHASGEERIKTIRGVGYILTVPRDRND